MAGSPNYSLNFDIIKKCLGDEKGEPDRFKVLCFCQLCCQCDEIFSGFIFPNHIFDNMLHVLLSNNRSDTAVSFPGIKGTFFMVKKISFFYYPTIG